MNNQTPISLPHWIYIPAVGKSTTPARRFHSEIVIGINSPGLDPCFRRLSATSSKRIWALVG
jgi:hypothetical protein